MNLFRKIFTGLLIIIALLALVSFCLPGKVHVGRSGYIHAPAKTVFNQINSLKNWKNWSYWDRLDPQMKSQYEGPESGTGAVHKWTSKHESVGNGSLTITESTEPSKVLFSLAFEGIGPTAGGWTIEETGDSVKATTFMDLDLPFLGRIFPGLFLDKMIGADFEKTIEGLKSYSEANIDTPVSEWKIEKVTTSGSPVLAIKIKCSGKEFKSSIEYAFSKLEEVMTTQGLKQTGDRFAIYHRWSKDSVELEPGIPVDTTGKPEGNVQAMNLPALNAVKVDLYGDPETSAEVYTFINDWMIKNNVTQNGDPWEEYCFDPASESDTSKWLTKIYFPVE